ncbi:hypothetical protein C8R47DRAFT_1126732 [Mycena vitilis]|nr:hypothetical protein C8R47DRAFT_1126732 [Mycena vitilis]
MSLVLLGEYLILLVCLQLPLPDITSLRQVCRFLYHATHSKILWIDILHEKVPDEWTVLPPYLKGYDTLDPAAFEALVRRISRISHKWKTGSLTPVKHWSFSLPQSITWLRLVNGNWLFVASSDNCCSKISCWELSLVFQGRTEPLAEAYLPGRVKTAKVEVQASGIVLALGLGVDSLSVHVITLRQRLGRHVFYELCRIEDSSHVLMLSGNLIGCAQRNGAITSHLINWEKILVYDIPPPPGGLDIPGRRNVPHLMTLWNDFLVILRKDTLEFYTLPSATNDSIIFAKLLKTPTIWEATVCPSLSKASSASPLRLLGISAAGIESCVVEPQHVLAGLNGDPACASFRLARSPGQTSDQEPWYRLCIGQTGRRSLWISACQEDFFSPPHFVYAGVPSSQTKMPLRPWNNEEDLALWAFPVVDFDEALGFTVVGNCFGELAIYDHDGRYPERCGALAIDFTDQPSQLLPPLSIRPVDLRLPIAPKRGMSDLELGTSALAQWSKDNLGLELPWRTQWLGYDGYHRWELWHGTPCDYAWELEHAYGFPGLLIPQAYEEPEYLFTQHVLFRVGNRYFIFLPECDEPDTRFRSWSLARIRGFDVPDAHVETCMRETAFTERCLYRAMQRDELDSGRNRWVELTGRGGRVDERLLDMESLE